MYLWTEFEGVTIDSAFALTKLVQTEGRSAFFSTLNENGESVLIRIIECHFDEDEILARWRGLQTLSHPNFLRIDRFGQFYMAADDITAVYAVFERVDANLGEVLERGRLTVADAGEIGHSVTAALETLHAAGFVHEHIETRNVYAVGDAVKLRSDCIRETPEGEAGIGARRRDVRDLAGMLMNVLLGAPRGSTAERQPLLPAPFDEIVRNGMNGTWGLAEIKAALGKLERPKAAPQKSKRPDPPVVKPAAPKLAELTPQAASIASSTSSSAISAKPRSAERPAEGASDKVRLPKSDVLPEWSATYFDKAQKHADVPRQKSPLDVPVIFGISERDFRKWMVTGAFVLGVVLISWILLHHWLGRDTGTAGQTTSSQSSATNSHAAATPKTESSPVAGPARKNGSQAGLQGKKEWRVVAFTYNRQDQAQKKVSSLGHQHPGLMPAVFSPTGQAPWLVTVGGVLQRDAAYALARKARSLGLPRDTYAQDYNVR
jgi:eukaryotic-like serine/threonine-protein kinase